MQPKFLALTAMEFLMQRAAVFSRYTRATARSSLYEKQGTINKNAMKGRNRKKVLKVRFYETAI
jgi:hypothetical protein